MLVIGDIVRLNAKRYPDKKAVIMEDDYFTYRQLNNLANQLANTMLAQGVKPGEKVALLSQNCLEFVIINYAVAKCGAVLVPINFRFKEKELAYTVRDCGARILFFEQEFTPLIEEARSEFPSTARLVPISGEPLEDGITMKSMIEGSSASEPIVSVDPASAAAIMYTSGTTGTPKGVLMSHSSLLGVNTGVIVEGDLRSSDTSLVVVPLFHNGGLNVIFQPTLQMGATAVIMGKGFDPEKFLEAITRYNVTLTLVVPTQLAMLTNFQRITSHKIPSLNKLWYGSSAISPEVLEASRDLFKIRFYQWFGQSEAGIVGRLRPEDHEEHSQCTGREMFNADIRIVDEEGNDTPVGEVGELISARKYLGMIGYHNMEEETKKTIRDGWVYTEDMARLEEEGFFTIVDRQRDMINSGGENIYSKEIEDVIMRMPSVQEVAVFGIPDDIWGEAVCAVVVKKEGHELEKDEVIDFCVSKLSGYKKPKKVEFMADLPKNPSGKITKNELREKYWKGRKRRV
ncbi:class I adenylate-forming enzyme family protein [Thermodesulfobacteriota bacterium]